ncbi:MAG: cytochrome c biogenesis protein CcdA [Anaerolineae bacterium]
MGNSGMGNDGSRLALVVSLAVPAILVVGLLVLLVSLGTGLEQAVSNLATLLPVGYAFAAGMVASVNPCGALMLPSYIFFQLGTEEDQASVLERLLKALRIAIATTAGFTAIFGLVGFVVSAGGRWLTSVFPVAGLVIGLAMLGLGVWLLLSHRSLGILAASRVSVRPERSLWNMFLFGIAYAISSLSCTLPIFLVVIGSALGSAELFVSLAQFLGYALGMGAILAAITVGTALFREVVERWLRRLMPYVHRLSALFLVGAGVYLIYYWTFEVGLVR